MVSMSNNVVNFITKAMKSWRVELSAEKQTPVWIKIMLIIKKKGKTETTE